MSSNIKILIVDDEEYGRDTYQMLVESSGFEAMTAGSADEARELLEANVFQIVLCDINMPKTDGITFLKEIKGRSGARIEVIMITGYASVDTAVEAMKTGAFGYFIKSGDPAELLMEIDKAVAVVMAAYRAMEHLSRSECFRCFKQFTHKTPTEYINEYRLTHAVRMLTESSASISDISCACGFSSSSYFCKLFKKMYNVTPMQYRNKFR